jgi:hypothetical protein
VLLLFQVAEAVQSESGILCVVVAGVVVGNSGTRVSELLQEFEEQLTVALIAVVFVLLAADVRLADLIALGWNGAATVAALVLVVRPLCVFACTAQSDLALREKIFLALVAPRGIVAAAVASLFAGFMAQAGVAGGTELRALVFLTIIGTVVFCGAAAPLLATLLRVRAPERNGVAILGAEELGLTLGELLRDAGAAVTVFDSNPHHCRAAAERGFGYVSGNALEEHASTRAVLQSARVAVALTLNDGVNSLFAREAMNQYRVSEGLVLLTPQRRVPEPMLEREGIRTAFDGPKDPESWNVSLRHGRARIALLEFAGRADLEPLGEDDDRFVFLLRLRGDAWQVVHRGLEWRDGDRAWVAIERSSEAAALARLVRAGWREPAAA